MGRGRITPDETIERIKATYAETGDVQAAANAAHVSWSTARKYVGSRDEFESIRAEKRIDIIARIAEVQIQLLDSMVDADSLKKASLSEKSVAFGIVTDKHLLLTGQATQRTENLVPDPAARLTPDELEAASRIRAKLEQDGL